MALKTLATAKTRIGHLPGPLRQRLALTMAVDTLRALQGAVDALVVVSDEQSLRVRLAAYGVQAEVLTDNGVTGLNPALTRGAEHLVARGVATVLAAVGDLPALRSESVRAVLAARNQPGRFFLADATGVGTTMLIAHWEPLTPHFGGPSAAAHRASGATEITGAVLAGIDDARRDVDEEGDLADAYRLGLPGLTGQLLDGSGRLASYDTVEVAGPAVATSSETLTVITRSGARAVLPRAAIDPTVGPMSAGKNLQATLIRRADQDRAVVTSAWE